ncbi:MAG: NIPSNAP family protein [Acidimicrobiia bacterium]|nr:NIPSNAP family protein [Acidimicrobiia bacterium]MDH5289709.1 NIPSNAP family protein [Acidimicrobiia bacterium]
MIHELRIYTAHPGKMGALLSRFRDHTCTLFEKHGITNVGYWLNSIGGRNDELWYIVGFESLAHREQAWAAFQADPEWQKVRADSEADGPLVHHLENRIMSPTNFSPLR